MPIQETGQSSTSLPLGNNDVTSPPSTMTNCDKPLKYSQENSGKSLCNELAKSNVHALNLTHLSMTVCS